MMKTSAKRENEEMSMGRVCFVLCMRRNGRTAGSIESIVSLNCLQRVEGLFRPVYRNVSGGAGSRTNRRQNDDEKKKLDTEDALRRKMNLPITKFQAEHLTGLPRHASVAAR